MWRGVVGTAGSTLPEGSAMSNLRIMIVEDNGLLAALLAELLTTMGHEVCATETSATGAAAAAARQRPDLILVDVGLSEGDGRSAMADIARTRAVPHIYITGGPLTAEGFPPGAVVLRKPFSERLLAQAITRALTQAQAPQI